ncbi:glycosyltransferase [Helicobacter sp. 12S02634-8]|uniref:glycosyltransferase n=1 Tax=Helicobacter sp. 12S02634-8 TaxID=1476199 RepID=UPI000BA703C5|nr:glycosyltransferase [Helicobacter sp. 12S02634-8]
MTQKPTHAQIKPLLVMSLGRKGGCVQYAQHILAHLNLPYTLYETTYIQEPPSKGAKSIKTYRRTRLSFACNTLFRLPFLALKLCIDSHKYSALFLPYFHFWNLAFICVFKLIGKPVILIEHDGIIHTNDGMPFEQSLINASIKRADTIIFLTHFVKNSLSPKLLAHKHTAVIPHGIFALKHLHTTPKTYTTKPTILFFGRINPYKGIHLLLNALASLPLESFEKLIIAGKSSYTYDLSYPQAFLDKLEIHDTFLSQESIAEIFNRSHILVMPYLEASQSGVASIGIANAIPTICTDVGGLKEQFISFRGGGGRYQCA